jgi:hypothetical protein
VVHPAALCGLGERAAPLASLQLVSLAEPAYAVCHREQLLLAVNSAAELGMGKALKCRVCMVFGTTLLGASIPTPVLGAVVCWTHSALFATWLGASTRFTPVRDALPHPRFTPSAILATWLGASRPTPVCDAAVGCRPSALLATWRGASTPTPVRDAVVGCTHSALLATWLGASTPTPVRDAVAGCTLSALVTTWVGAPTPTPVCDAVAGCTLAALLATWRGASTHFIMLCFRYDEKRGESSLVRLSSICSDRTEHGFIPWNAQKRGKHAPRPIIRCTGDCFLRQDLVHGLY